MVLWLVVEVLVWLVLHRMYLASVWIQQLVWPEQMFLALMNFLLHVLRVSLLGMF